MNFADPRVGLRRPDVSGIGLMLSEEKCEVYGEALCSVRLFPHYFLIVPLCDFTVNFG